MLSEVIDGRYQDALDGPRKASWRREHLLWALKNGRDFSREDSRVRVCIRPDLEELSFF